MGALLRNQQWTRHVAWNLDLTRSLPSIVLPCRQRLAIEMDLD